MITFVVGIPCCGKSSFIAENFPNAKTIDVRDYQKKKILSVQDIVIGYEMAKEDLLKAAMEGDVVMEHTLLKKSRRKEQIDFLRNGGYTGEIHLIFINPPVKVIKKRMLMRNVCEDICSFLKMHCEILEMPTEEEGFTSIRIIEDY